MKMRNRRKARFYNVAVSFVEQQVAGFQEAMASWMDHIRGFAGLAEDHYGLIRKINNFPDEAHFETSAAETTLLEAVKDAIEFVRIFPERMPLPWASYNPDGDVFLKWKHGDLEAEMAFSGHNEIGYSLLRGGKFEAGVEHATTIRVPQDLIDYLCGESDEDAQHQS